MGPQHDMHLSLCCQQQSQLRVRPGLLPAYNIPLGGITLYDVLPCLLGGGGPSHTAGPLGSGDTGGTTMETRDQHMSHEEHLINKAVSPLVLLTAHTGYVGWGWPVCGRDVWIQGMEV